MTGTAVWLEKGAVLAELHVPAQHANTGVVVCPPLGQQHIIAYRALRYLSERLEDEGIASVRFDYAGHGDSTVDQDTVSLLGSVRIAARALVEAGCTRVVYVGLSVGALLAQEAAREDPEAAALVLWDPSPSAKQWMRRSHALYGVAVGTEVMASTDSHDGFDIVGGRLTRGSVSELSDLRYDPSVAGLFPTLAVVRRGRSAAFQPRNGAGATVSPQVSPEFLQVDGQESFLDVPGPISEVPWGDIERIASWVRELLAGDERSDDSPAAPEAQSSVDFDFADDSTGALVRLTESLVRVGPERLFAIETSSPAMGPDAPAIVLHTGSSDHRIGTAGIFVTLARRLASQGIRVVRLDRRGAGESGAVGPGEPNLQYTQDSLDDAQNAIAFLGLPADRVATAGICVGGWLAICSDPATASLMFGISVQYYNPSSSVAGAIREAAKEYASAPVQAGDSFQRRIKHKLPYPLLRLLSRAHVVEVVENLLRAPLRAGVDIVLLMTPADVELYEEQSGRAAERRLVRTPGRLQTVSYEEGDHSLFGVDIRERIVTDIVNLAVRHFARQLTSRSDELIQLA